MTVGLVTSLTGPNASTFTGTVPGARARFALQNAQGGVNGRKIELVSADDTSSPSAILTAVQVLVQSKGVFAVLPVSGFTFGAARYMQENGIPAVGSALDGSEWYQQPYTNMFSITGPSDPHYPQYTLPASFFKDHGATNVSAFGYATSPSSTAAAKGFAFAAKHEGLSVGYLNTSVPFAGVDVTSDALGMKNAGVNGVFMPIALNTTLALLTAAKQAGVNLKVSVLSNGYGYALLNQPAPLQAAQGVYFEVPQAPVELHTPATQAEQAALAKYANFNGVPSFDYIEGWLTADLFIRGLQAAGTNPTRQSYIDGLHGVTNWDGGGLLPSPEDFSLSKFGHAQPQNCSYLVQVQGSSFIPVPSDGKPVCGTLIPNSDQT